MHVARLQQISPTISCCLSLIQHRTQSLTLGPRWLECNITFSLIPTLPYCHTVWLWALQMHTFSNHPLRLSSSKSSTVPITMFGLTTWKQLCCHELTKPHRGVVWYVLRGRRYSEDCRIRRQWTRLGFGHRRAGQSLHGLVGLDSPCFGNQWWRDKIRDQ